MKAFARVAILSALILSGCGQKDEPLPPVPTPPPAPAPTAGTPGSSSNAPAPAPTQPRPNNPTPANAAAQYVGNLGNAQQYATVVSQSATINQAIQVFNANEGRYPKDLNELVTEKYLGHVPTPPRGMKFYYNPENGDFRIVDDE